MMQMIQSNSMFAYMQPREARLLNKHHSLEFDFKLFYQSVYLLPLDNTISFCVFFFLIKKKLMITGGKPTQFFLS